MHAGNSSPKRPAYLDRTQATFSAYAATNWRAGRLHLHRLASGP